jgi:hypothetical protein
VDVDSARRAPGRLKALRVTGVIVNHRVVARRAKEDLLFTLVTMTFAENRCR